MDRVWGRFCSFTLFFVFLSRVLGKIGWNRPLRFTGRTGKGIDMDRFVLTNNPLVREKLQGEETVEFVETGFMELLSHARDYIHGGHKLLTHPLSGSVKPMETPYKSLMLTKSKGPLDLSSLGLIENALDACRKFQFRYEKHPERVAADFQFIDWTLIESALR